MSLTSQENFNLLASILSNHPLIKINKELLLEQLRNEIFKIERKKQQFNNNLLNMNKQIIYNMTQYKALSTIKIQPNEKISNFDIKLKEQQEEFNNFNNNLKPHEIDFTDKIEEPKILTLDETLKKRENDLKTILKNNKKKITTSLFDKKVRKEERKKNKNVTFLISENENVNENVNNMNQNNINQTNLGEFDVFKVNIDNILKNQNKILENQVKILDKLERLDKLETLEKE